MCACALAALALGTATLASADSASRPAAISVNVSLESCDPAGTECSLDVSFGALPEADTYGALIKGPDGSILERAAADPAGSFYTVPYVGDGTYTVRITGYGSFDESAGTRPPLASGQSGPG